MKEFYGASPQRALSDWIRVNRIFGYSVTFQEAAVKREAQAVLMKLCEVEDTSHISSRRVALGKYGMAVARFCEESRRGSRPACRS